MPFALAFFGQSDPTMEIMTRNFFEINEKLDRIDSHLEEMKVLITSATQKAAYIKVESDIEFGYRQMKLMFKKWKEVGNNCDSKKQCRRARIKIAENYAEKMDGAEKALNVLLRGLAGNGSEFAESLMSIVQRDTNCDIPQMMSVYEKIFFLARKGQMVVVVLTKLRESKTSVLESMDHWLKNMYAFRDRMYETTDYCYQNINKYVHKDLEKMSGFDVDYIQRHLNMKYDWVDWVSKKYLSASR